MDNNLKMLNDWTKKAHQRLLGFHPKSISAGVEHDANLQNYMHVLDEFDKITRRIEKCASIFKTDLISITERIKNIESKNKKVKKVTSEFEPSNKESHGRN